MKNIILVFALAIVFSFNTLTAQNIAFKVEPFDLVLERYTGEVEYLFSEKNSIIVNYQKRDCTKRRDNSILFSFLLGTSSTTRIEGQRFDLLYRRYVGENRNLKGFYFESGFGYGNYDVRKTSRTSGIFGIFHNDVTEIKYTASTTRFILKSGYQVCTPYGFTFDMGLGIRHQSVKSSSFDAKETFNEGLRPQVDFKVGIAF